MLAESSGESRLKNQLEDCGVSQSSATPLLLYENGGFIYAPYIKPPFSPKVRICKHSLESFNIPSEAIPGIGRFPKTHHLTAPRPRAVPCVLWYSIISHRDAGATMIYHSVFMTFKFPRVPVV